MNAGQTYNFRSPFSIKEILQLLKKETPWVWRERDNDRWGEYISAAPYQVSDSVDDQSQFKVIEDEGRIIFYMFFTSTQPNASEQWDGYYRTVKEKLLPLLKAEDIREDPDFE